MALTLEDGTGKPDADSFVSLAEVRAFATSRGRSVSGTDSVLEALVRKAHDYLLRLEGQFMGRRAVENQSLPFPRCGMTIFGRTIADNVIPATLKNAVMQLVCEGTDVDLLPTASGRAVVSETVGPLSTTYADTGANAAMPTFPAVDAFLRPLLMGGGALRAERA